MASCEIVEHSIARVGDVRNPVVGIYVIDAKQIECVESYPSVLNPLQARITQEIVIVVEQAIRACTGWVSSEGLYSSHFHRGMPWASGAPVVSNQGLLSPCKA